MKRQSHRRVWVLISRDCVHNERGGSVLAHQTQFQRRATVVSQPERR